MHEQMQDLKMQDQKMVWYNSVPLSTIRRHFGNNIADQMTQQTVS